MFHVIEKEMEWRTANGLSEGFQSLRKLKPLVAVGADGPLEDQLQMAAYFRKRNSKIQCLQLTRPF